VNRVQFWQQWAAWNAHPQAVGAPGGFHTDLDPDGGIYVIPWIWHWVVCPAGCGHASVAAYPDSGAAAVASTWEEAAGQALVLLHARWGPASSGATYAASILAAMAPAVDGHAMAASSLPAHPYRPHPTGGLDCELCIDDYTPAESRAFKRDPHHLSE
jgi:hypothetical protein